MRRSLLSPWGWKGPSTKSDYNDPGVWQILRSNNTSRMTSSTESRNTYVTPSNIFIALPEPPTSQLMVTTHKAEICKNEEIWDKVRDRATVATDPGEGMAELGQQIAKLMAAWPRLDRTAIPLVCQVAPGREAMGGDAMVVIPAVAQTPTMAEVALDRPPQPTAYPLGVGQGAMELGVMDRTIKGLAQGEMAQPVGWDTNSAPML